uniref:Uncharacterized protein n=1 Tax=Solanum lycopersicum TaxID=4081 RepID=A0A3Q7IE28_SOLLC
MWDAHRSWIREGLFAKHENKRRITTVYILRHDQDRYKKGKARIPVPFDFGVDIVDNKNWFYNLYSKGQLLNDSLTMYDYYKNRGLDKSVSQEENDLFEIVFIDNIPQQSDDSLARYATLLWNYAKQKQDNGAISESEAPPRHAMPQFVRVVSAPIEIQ